MRTKKHLLTILLLLITMMCTACGRPTLCELLERDPAALDVLRSSSGANDVIVKCKDYVVYYEGGTDDSINATRYARGLEEISDRFAEYHYIVENKETGWKYIFEDISDISMWVD